MRVGLFAAAALALVAHCAVARADETTAQSPRCFIDDDAAKADQLTICANVFDHGGEVHEAVAGDACRLERLWADGAVISRQRFYLDRPAVLTTKHHPFMANCLIDGSSLLDDEAIVFADNAGGTVMSNVFHLSWRSSAIVISSDVPKPATDCGDLVS